MAYDNMEHILLSDIVHIGTQKHEIYPEMQWTFGIQANLDTIDTKY